MKHACLVVTALIALAGCSNKQDSADVAAGSGPEAAVAGSDAASPGPAGSAKSPGERNEPIQTLADELEPGLWQLSLTVTTIDAPDAPPMLRGPLEALKGATQSYSHCLPADQTGRPDPEFFGNDSSRDCTYDRFRQSGDFTTISMTCGGEGGRRVRTNMQGTLGPKSFDMAVANDMLNSPNGKIRLAGKLTGKRTGACGG